MPEWTPDPTLDEWPDDPLADTDLTRRILARRGSAIEAQ
jgi:hypothetical protein